MSVMCCAHSRVPILVACRVGRDMGVSYEVEGGWSEDDRG